MCNHEWERIERPYQYQTDKAEGIAFCDGKVRIICKKCIRVCCCTVRQLAAAVPTPFLEAGIGAQ